MNKCYALRYLKDENSLWSDVIAVSNDYNKLGKFMFGVSCVYSGTPDKHNEPNVVRYSDCNTYPQYKIEEIAYVC